MSRIISNIFIVSCPLSFGLPFQHTMQVPFFLNLVFLKGKLHGRSGRNMHFGFPCQRICGWEHRYRRHRMATLTFGHRRHIVFFLSMPSKWRRWCCPLPGSQSHHHEVVMTSRSQRCSFLDVPSISLFACWFQPAQTSQPTVFSS